MTYPNITPIDLGRDGWSVLYSDATSRLLFLCGLRVEANVVRGKRATSSYGVASNKVVKDSELTPKWDGRTVKPTREGVQGAIKSLMRLRGRPMAQAILHRYGAQSVADLDKRWYGCVYAAAHDMIRDSAR